MDADFCVGNVRLCRLKSIRWCATRLRTKKSLPSSTSTRSQHRRVKFRAAFPSPWPPTSHPPFSLAEGGENAFLVQSKWPSVQNKCCPVTWFATRTASYTKEHRTVPKLIRPHMAPRRWRVMRCAAAGILFILLAVSVSAYTLPPKLIVHSRLR
jgi:hypothetical protein